MDRDKIRNEQVYLINDSFQNRKQYNIPKAQLVLTDIPYNLANNAYASNPQLVVLTMYRNLSYKPHFRNSIIYDKYNFVK